jgi:hypothetical protein
MRRERDEVRGSMLASRSVVSVLSRSLGDFLYTLKAGPAGGRQGRAFQEQAGLRATRKELQSLAELRTTAEGMSASADRHYPRPF